MDEEPVALVAGPLEQYLDGFNELLIGTEHYLHRPAVRLVGLMRHLSD
jgi:hypothetical protein